MSVPIYVLGGYQMILLGNWAGKSFLFTVLSKETLDKALLSLV